MPYLHFELIGSRQTKIILLLRTQVYLEADMVIFYLYGFSSHFPTSPTLFAVIAPLSWSWSDMVIFYLYGFSSHFPTSPTLFAVIAPLSCCPRNESLSPTIFLVTSALTLSLALPALCPEGRTHAL